MINPVNTSVLTANHKVADGLKPVVDKPDIKNSALHQVDGKSDRTRVSTLARQLAESAVRAEARERDMSREQLRAYAMKMHDQLHRSEADTWAPVVPQVPDTDDPELLERARQATNFVISTSRGDRSVRNPFANLTREQTGLIGYDDAGPYTKHEREAALWHGERLEQQWRVGLFARSDEESRQFGTSVGFYTECLVHHKSLPLIEQVQYGGLEYEARLGRWIAEEMEGFEPTDRLLTLFEVLARMGFPELAEKYQKPPADEAVQAARKAMNAPSATSQAAPKQLAAQISTPITEPTTLKTSSLSPDVFPSPVAVERS
jgi:hypothetical protein